MKKTLSAFISLLLFCSTVAMAAPQGEWGPRTLEVVGEGSVSVAPDIATVRIGVESIDPRVDRALAASRKTILAISSSLAELGVDAKDMQTANYSFNFERSQRTGTSGRATYMVNNMLTVTIRNLAITGEIIDAAVLSGANQMWGVDFSIQDTAPVIEEATRLAVAATEDKAEALADMTGHAVGDLLSIRELFEGDPAFLSTLSGGDSAVSPGVITFTVRLTAIYRLENR